MAIAKAAETNTFYVFQDGFLQNQKFITENTIPYIAEIAKAAGIDTSSVLAKGFPSIKELITEKNILSIGLQLTKITKTAEDAEYVFEHCFPLMKKSINETNLSSIGLQLDKLVKALGWYVGSSLYEDLSQIKRVITEKTLPDLIENAEKAGKNSYIVIRDGLLETKNFITENNFSNIKNYFIQILKGTKGIEEDTFCAFSHLKFYFSNFNINAFDLLIIPTVNAQGPASFLCFKSYGKIAELHGVSSEKDIDLLRWIVEKKQRKANDVLKNVIVKGLESKIISKPISQDADILKEFLENSPAYLIELYVEFRNIHLGTGSDKHIYYEKLFHNIIQLKNEIISGTLSKAYDQNIVLGVLFSVFAPEVSVERTQYKKFYESRNDRQSDIPGVLNSLMGLTVKIAKGGFILKEEVNTASWNNLIEAVDEVNRQQIQIDFSKLGLNLLIEYLNGALRQKQKEYLKYLYAYNMQFGNSLPSFSSNHETLMKYKEFIGDRLRNDLIFSLLTKAQEKHPKEFSQLTNRQKDFKQFAKTLYEIWNSKVDKKDEKILEILKSKGFTAQKCDWPASITVEEINQILIQGSSSVIEKSLVQNIFNQLYGEQYANMQKEMTKFEFKKEGIGLFGKPYKFVLSKHKLHIIAMFNMGVCVAVDDKLWNEPDMWQMIIFDEEENACGGVIYRTIQEDNNTYLVASIQPSSIILGEVSPNQLYKKIIQYSRLIVKKLGYTSLLIPTDSAIHSNRGSIQELITSNNYSQIRLKNEHTFSYSPYHYEYQKFYLA